VADLVDRIELRAEAARPQGPLRRRAVFGRRGGSIGRAAGNDLVLDDPARAISRLQAFLAWGDDGFRIRCVGLGPMSLNGMALKPGAECPLRPGDRLRVGDWTLTARAAEDGALPFGDPFFGAPAAPAVAPAVPQPPAAGAPSPFDFSLGDVLSANPRASDPFAGFPEHFELPEPPAHAAPDPVCFAVTAPPRFEPGRSFTVALAIHVESLRERVAAQLARLGGPGAVPLLDLPPHGQSGWRPGAPVTVRLQAEGADSPPPVELEWSGRSNLAVFPLRPAEPTPARIDLVFHVLLAGVPMGLVPLTVEGPAGDSPPAAALPRRAPNSAFASYASADAQAVGLCLSALSRWAPTLAIFQDCLDLQPGEAFKPQLERRIRDSDAFLLFWSRRAAQSRWVRWEFDVARAGKGLDAVIPMPLEDPALAPPPPELADRHWRDRYMMARAGLARIADEVR
jgi:hypothetical protein